MHGDAEALAHRVDDVGRRARAAPETHSRTPRERVGGRGGRRRARATRRSTAGTAATTVTPSRAHARRASRPDGSGRRATRPRPRCNARPSTTLRPKTWKNGSTPSATSSAVDAQPGVRLHLFEVREQRTVREHRGLRRARRARGEQQHREIVGVACDGRGRAAAVARFGVEHQQRRCAASARAVARRAAVGVLGGRDEERGRDDPRARARAPARARRVERHRDRARRQRREVGGHERGLVAGDDRDPVAGARPCRPSTACAPRDPCARARRGSPDRRRRRAPADRESLPRPPSSAVDEVHRLRRLRKTITALGGAAEDRSELDDELGDRGEEDHERAGRTRVACSVAPPHRCAPGARRDERERAARAQLQLRRGGLAVVGEGAARRTSRRSAASSDGLASANAWAQRARRPVSPMRISIVSPGAAPSSVSVAGSDVELAVAEAVDPEHLGLRSAPSSTFGQRQDRRRQ